MIKTSATLPFNQV